MSRQYPPHLRLPPLKARIYALIQQSGPISGRELHAIVWDGQLRADYHGNCGHTGDVRALKTHILQLNQILCLHGWRISGRGGYRLHRLANPS